MGFVGFGEAQAVENARAESWRWRRCHLPESPGRGGHPAGKCQRPYVPLQLLYHVRAIRNPRHL